MSCRSITLIALLSACAGVYADVDESGTTELSLGQAISRLEAAGEIIVYSPGIANPRTLIHLPTDTPLDILSFSQALHALSLELEKSADGTWFIVRQQRRTAVIPSVLTGRVTSATTGEPLPGVAVEIAGVIAFTDADGWFVVPAREAQPVQIRADGYQPKTLPSASAQHLLEVPLEPETGIEEVVVVSSRYSLQRAQGPSMATLDVDELTGIPELGDDAIRAASHLPGMATVGVSAAPHIRGGLQDELLILFNNVELLEPFHLKDFQSVFASFNPSLIESVDVYTGGFPARFGDRMSGVMDIKPAIPADDFQAELMVSFLTASASAAGISNDDRGRWALSARRGNLDLVLDQIDRSTGNPKYSDYFASFSYDLANETQLEFGLIAYDDDVLLKDLDEGDGEQGKSKYDNLYAWTQLHHDWSPRNTSTTLFSYGNIDHKHQGFINDLDPEEGSSQLNDRRSFNIFALAHRQYLDISERLAIEVGGRFGYQEGHYDTQALIVRGGIGEIIGLPPTQVIDVQTRPGGTSGGAYASMRVRPMDLLTVEFGGRWDFQDYAESFDQQFSPRVSAMVQLRENTQLRLSAGRFYQPQRIQELQAADGISRFQAPQYADHYIVGLDQLFPAQNISLRLEGFVKAIRDPKIRFENLFNPWVLMPEIASDRVAIEPEKARAQGFEFSLGYEPTQTFNSWASYSYSDVEDRIEGEWQPRGWDQEHTLSTGFIWQPGNWSVSAALLWHSGWRTTKPPASVVSGETPQLQRNADTLPDYLSLDARIARSWHGERQSVSVFAEVTNLLDDSNVGAYEYDFEETSTGYDISGERFTLLPRVASLGIRWTFH